MSIADIRRGQSGATKTVRDFKKALKGLRKRMVSAVQRRGRRRFKLMHKRYEKELYANRRGKVRRIRRYSKRHAELKKELRLDKRRGHMRKGISKHIKSPKSFTKTDTGFIVNIKAPNLTITGKTSGAAKLRSIAGKAIIRNKQVVGHQVKFQKTTRKSFLVNRYIDPFADRQARGLGSMAESDHRALDKAAKEAVEKHLKKITKAATRSLAGKAVQSLTLDVSRWV